MKNFIKQITFASILGFLLLISACDILNPPNCKTVGGILYCTSNNSQVNQVGNKITFKPSSADKPYTFEILKGINTQIPHFETNRFAIKNDSSYSQTEFYGTVAGIKNFSMTTAWAIKNGRVQLAVSYPTGSNIVSTQIKYYRRMPAAAGGIAYELMDQTIFTGSSTQQFSNCLVGQPITKTSAQIAELSLQSVGQNSYDKPIVIEPKMSLAQTCNLMVIIPMNGARNLSFDQLKAQKLTITLNKFKSFSLLSSETLPTTL